MCGIAGFCLSADENVNAAQLAVPLLLGIENRGTHATGVAYFDDGVALIEKAAVPARTFVPTLDMPSTVRNAILHTRHATQGSPQNNDNNHPIDVGGLIGVHNGIVYNDDELFDRLPDGVRIAEVDSEAIFATLYHGGEKPAQALARVQGPASVAWINTYGDPELLHVARVGSFPFQYAFTEAGSFIFASDQRTITTAAAKAGVTIAGGPYSLDSGRYLMVRAGQVLNEQVIDRTATRRPLTRRDAELARAANGGTDA